MSKLIKKLGLKSTILIVIGLLCISVGVIFNFSEKKSAITNTKKVHLAVGDYFSAKLSNQTIEKGKVAQIPLKIDDISINSGDKGIGVLSFKYTYDTDAFTDISFTSTVATVTVNKSTKEVIAVVNNGNVITTTTNILTVSLQSNANTTKNSAEFSITDVKGSSGEIVTASDASCTITFSEIPETPSTIDNTNISFASNGNSTYSTGAGTMITAEYDNIKSIKYIWINGDETPEDNEFVKTTNNGGIVSTNGGTGDYYLWVLVRLNTGEGYKARSNAFKLDNKNPTIPTISSSNSTSNVEVGHDVNLTISGSTALSGIEKYEYSFNNGESWNTYDANNGINITEEGTTTVIARAKSNTGKYSSVSNKYIVKIVRTPMVLSYHVSTFEKTNEDVTVTISSNTKLIAPSGWTLCNEGYGIYKVYSQNTEERVTITDENGNTDSITVNITQIDKTMPELTINYNEHDNYVEVVITSNEEMQTKDNWNLSNNKKALTRNYYHNTNENITAYDLAGNSTTINVNVTTIQEGEFNLNVEYTPISESSVEVAITSDANLKPITGWTLSQDKKKLTKVYSENISENLTVIDENNNKKNINISYIFSNEKPETNLEIHSSNNELTNESVAITITSDKELTEIDGWSLSDDSYSMTKVYGGNTEEKVTVQFTDDTTEEVTVKITNIDKDKPIINEAVDNGVYESLDLSFSDDIKNVEIEKDGEKIEYKEGMKITEKGNYKIVLIDKAGNKSTYNITINTDTTLVEVPNTGSNYTKILIIIGILELLVGLLYIFKFKVNDKINVSIVIMIIAISRINPSVAADSLLSINGYTVKDGKIYNIEATTTESNLKANLDNYSGTTIRKNSSGSYVSTGDTLTYKDNTYTIIINGDINSDGEVKSSDLTAGVNHMVSSSKITNANKLEALDYNNDNIQDISDIYLISKRINHTYTISVKGLSVNAPTSIDAGHASSITAKVYPVNASNKTVNYSIISGGAYSTLSGSTIKGTKAGTTTVRVKSGSVYKDVSYNIKNSYKLHILSNTAASDAMILESNGSYGMIDTGDPAQYNQIKNYLDNLGVTKLDFMIVTHAHNDHMANAEQIIKNYGVDTLYIKKYSYADGKGDKLQPIYKKIIEAAVQKGADIQVYGYPKNSNYSNYTYILTGEKSYTKSTLSLGSFNIKLFNLDDQSYTTRNSNCTFSENLNSLVQLLTIEVNGNPMTTFLEGDLTYSNSCLRSYDGDSNKTVKEVILFQVMNRVRDYSLDIDVYKPAHHGFYNGTSKKIIETLEPQYIIATSSQETINSKTQTNKLCPTYYAKQYLGNKFKTNYKTIDNDIVIDYSSGSVKITGGAAWNESTYPIGTPSCTNYLNNSDYLNSF